jgi:hypothetical protein
MEARRCRSDGAVSEAISVTHGRKFVSVDDDFGNMGTENQDFGNTKYRVNV